MWSPNEIFDIHGIILHLLFWRYFKQSLVKQGSWGEHFNREIGLGGEIKDYMASIKMKIFFYLERGAPLLFDIFTSVSSLTSPINKNKRLRRILTL